jgi:hypothetical protein
MATFERKVACCFCGVSLKNPSKCSKCKSPYCNRDCQVKDWARHKGVCGSEHTISEGEEKRVAGIVVEDLRSRRDSVLVKLMENEDKLLTVAKYSVNKPGNVSFASLNSMTIEQYAAITRSAPSIYKVDSGQVYIAVFNRLRIVFMELVMGTFKLFSNVSTIDLNDKQTMDQMIEIGND